MRKSQEIAKQIETTRKQYEKDAKAQFAAGLIELIAKYPVIRNIAWSCADEYNDETYELSSTHEEPRINGCTEYDDEEDDVNLNLFAKAAAGDAEAKSAIKEVTAYLTDFPDHFYHDMFGEGEVTVTAKGLTQS